MAHYKSKFKVLSRLFKRFRDRFKLLNFGSTLPIKTILVWRFYEVICSFSWLLSGNKLRNGAEFHDKGIAFLPNDSAMDAILLSRLNSYLKSQFYCTKGKYQQLDRSEDPVVFEAVWNFLSRNREIIESIVGWRFSCYWIMLYRTYPTLSEDKASSFAWHYDEDPRALKKIFIYLEDTTRKNGAFRFFNRENSLRLFKEFFTSNTPDRRITAQDVVNDFGEEKSEWMEGASGSSFIFDNNIVHRGTFPCEGMRTVISIEIIPSLLPLSKQNVKNSLSMPIVDDYPKIPWRNRYA
jgi:hypothetical protein